MKIILIVSSILNIVIAWYSYRSFPHKVGDPNCATQLLVDTVQECSCTPSMIQMILPASGVFAALLCVTTLFLIFVLERSKKEEAMREQV